MGLTEDRTWQTDGVDATHEVAVAEHLKFFYICETF